MAANFALHLIISFPNTIVGECYPCAQMTIPKKIHLCWFGRNDMSATVQRSIESIRKLEEHGYEVHLWTEDNYDINKSKRLQKAYADKKWSLVSNYVRLDVLKMHGGIYADTDIEIVRPFDGLLENDYFIGFMWDSALGTAIIGSVPDHPYVADILDGYENDPSTYISPNNNTFTEYFLAKVPGFKLNGRSQALGSAIILDKYAFEHPSFFKSKNYTIHHFEQSWKNRNTLKAAAKKAVIGLFSLWIYRKYICWKSLKLSPYLSHYRSACKA